MSKFDDIFSRKVKKAFDNFDADHLADRGWNSFAGKYGNKRSRTIIIPLWARAASIVILVTAGVLLMDRLNDMQTDEPADRLAQETGSPKTDSLSSENDTSSITAAVTSADQAFVAATEKSSQVLTATTPGAGQVSTAQAERATQAVNEDSEKGIMEITVAAMPPLSADINSAGGLAGVTLAGGPMEKRLTYEADTRLNLKPKPALKDYPVLPRERMTTTLMTGFSGMMASIDNTTSNAQGISVGFYVERQLSRRISVRPGLAMARHNYALETTPGGRAAFDYTAPELNGMSGTTTSYSADINVVSMEVPVNVVFSIRKRGQSSLFVTTGASTVLYLSQHLSGNFNNTYTKTIVDSYGDVSYESMTTSVKIESDQELLNRVDFMGLANFSAGYSFPFAGISHLVFEPFVQLPIKDLTSMNLRIMYGGLSFKVKF
ncbi:hypothetical protein EG830_01580 [bacterium]|nr:hypothetical protein [bacterium]